MTESTEAIDRTEGARRFLTRPVLVITAGHAAHDTFTAFLPPLLPLLITAMTLSKTEAGLLTVILQLPWLLQPWIGHAADGRHARWGVILAPAVSAFSMCLLGVMPSYAALVPLLLFSGAASAAFHVVDPAIISGFAGNRIGRGTGLWMVGGETGRALGPMVAVTAVGILGLRGLPWLMIGGAAASVALYFQFAGPAGGGEDEAAPLPWRALLRGLGPLLGPLAAIMFFRAFLVVALSTYLPLFLTGEGDSLWLAGIALTLFEAAGVAGALAGGAVSDHIGRRRTLFVSLVATPLLLLAFLHTDGPARFALLLLLGLTTLSVSPVIMALVLESFPGNRSLANGVYMVISFLIRSVAVLALGVAGDLAGLRTGFTLAAVAALFGLPFLALLPRRASREPRAASGRL